MAHPQVAHLPVDHLPTVPRLKAPLSPSSASTFNLSTGTPPLSSKPPSLRWQVTRRKLAATYPIFTIHDQHAIHPETGEERPFVIVDCPSWVNVIALTPSDEVVLVSQYRHGSDNVELEIPGGMVDPGEDPLHAGQRELAEETGYEAKEWLQLGVVKPNPAFQTNLCWTYLALDAQRTQDPTPDGGEVIEVTTQPLSLIPTYIKERTIDHSLVVAAFTHLLLHTGGWKRPS